MFRGKISCSGEKFQVLGKKFLGWEEILHCGFEKKKRHKLIILIIKKFRKHCVETIVKKSVVQKQKRTWK